MESTSKCSRLLFLNEMGFSSGVKWCCYRCRQYSLTSLRAPFILGHLNRSLERPLTKATSRRTIHILLIHSTYLTYRDRANGRNPYLNKEIVRLFEDILRRGPQGALKADALSWLARACKAQGERGYAEAYMRELIDDLLQDAALRDSSARNYMDDLEMWFIEWGEAEKAAELARWRQEELSAEVTAKFECDTGN